MRCAWWDPGGLPPGVPGVLFEAVSHFADSEVVVATLLNADDVMAETAFCFIVFGFHRTFERRWVGVVRKGAPAASLAVFVVGADPRR